MRLAQTNGHPFSVHSLLGPGQMACTLYQHLQALHFGYS